MSTCHPHDICRATKRCLSCGKKLDELLGQQVVFRDLVKEEKQRKLSHRHYAELHARSADEYNSTRDDMTNEYRKHPAHEVITAEIKDVGYQYPNSLGDLIVRALLKANMLTVPNGVVKFDGTVVGVDYNELNKTHHNPV